MHSCVATTFFPSGILAGFVYSFAAICIAVDLYQNRRGRSVWRWLRRVAFDALLGGMALCVPCIWSVLLHSRMPPRFFLPDGFPGLVLMSYTEYGSAPVPKAPAATAGKMSEVDKQPH